MFSVHDLPRLRDSHKSQKKLLGNFGLVVHDFGIKILAIFMPHIQIVPGAGSSGVPSSSRLTDYELNSYSRIMSTAENAEEEVYRIRDGRVPHVKN